jgi:uncharacterized membrane protein YeaQ/YmgE (transglycosylase-associated protein family)
MFISLICWLALGSIVGAISGKFVDAGDDDPKLGIAIAAIAAVVGGLLFRLYTKTPANWPGVMGLLTAAATAALAAVIWHFSRRASRA